MIWLMFIPTMLAQLDETVNTLGPYVDAPPVAFVHLLARTAASRLPPRPNLNRRRRARFVTFPDLGPGGARGALK